MSKFDSIHLNMQPNVVNYDLYLPSTLRQNRLVNIPIEVGKVSININAFKMLYEIDKNKYNKLIEKYSNIDSRMLFIGFSNSSAVFIEGGEQFIKFSNDNLKMHHACPHNSSVKRIIITDNESVNMPHVVPMSINGTFKFEPNYYGPKNSDIYENHISIYYIDEPTKYYYPQ